jgi:hypothetical protein
MAAPDDPVRLESYAIGQSILERYFPALQDDRPAAFHFYAPDAVVFWDSAQYSGANEIYMFLTHVLDYTTMFCAYSYSVQTVPGTNPFQTMVVVTGTVGQTGRIGSFHCTFLLRDVPDSDVNRAVIHSQIFRWLN